MEECDIELDAKATSKLREKLAAERGEANPAAGGPAR